VGSGTIPKMAMRTAPPAIAIVPNIMYGLKTSPSNRRAKNAFHKSDTAPRGASITTGSEAIWKSDPRRLEEINIPVRWCSSGPCYREAVTRPRTHRNLEATAYINSFTDIFKCQRKGTTHGLRCSTFCSCSGWRSLRTWLLRWMVKPRLCTKLASRPIVIPTGIETGGGSLACGDLINMLRSYRS
jgi:hypothetical protein